jgi:hypothetical protein
MPRPIDTQLEFTLINMVNFANYTVFKIDVQQNRDYTEELCSLHDRTSQDL